MDEVSEEECFSNVIVNIKHEKEDEEENLEEESHEFTGIDVNLVKCELKEEIPDSHDNNINKINEEPTNFVYVNVKEEREDISEEAEEFCNCTANVEEFNADVKDTLLKSLEVSKSSSDDSERPDSTKDIWDNTACKREIRTQGKQFTIIDYKDVIKCDEQFNDNNKLSHHDEEIIRYQCHVCKEFFNLKSHLNTHLLIHAGNTDYKCDLCNASFKYKSILASHRLSHSNEKHFRCEICGKCFTFNTNLVQHIKIHTDNRVHCCDVCDKSFLRNSDMKRHKKCHSVDEDYECSICNKRFISKSDLSRHMLIHGGDELSLCEICGKTFVMNYSLLQHLKIHTNRETHNCDVCGKCFTRKSNLKHHKKFHSDDKN